MKYLFVALINLLLIGCGGQKNNESKNTVDAIQQDGSNASGILKYDDTREDLKYKFEDTLRISKSFYFTNHETKDNFQLTIYPGLIKKSKSDFKIISNEGRIIYEQEFDSFYFIRGIFVPDSVPSGGQESYDRYLKEYSSSLTHNQYDQYVKKKIDIFFDHFFVSKEVINEVRQWDDVDKNLLLDTTIVLIDVPCFDCDEGGMMYYYSKERKKILTLVSHD